MAMPQTIPWTREDLDRLPDDGNTYEVLNGELFVTPAPSAGHEEIAAWLCEKLTLFAVGHGAGRVYRPRAIVVIDGSQVEPDVMVRPIAPVRGWEDAPIPILVVEILSRATRRRDLNQKRAFYIEKGISEYWVVDRNTRSVIRISAEGEETITAVLTWAPDGIAATLDIDVAAMFAECHPEA